MPPSRRWWKRSAGSPGAADHRTGSNCELWPEVRRALANKLYVDELYDRVIVRPLWALARGLWRVVDATLIDGLFVNGIPSLIAWVSAMARRFQNGDVQRYAAVTALGVAALLYVFLVRS